MLVRISILLYWTAELGEITDRYWVFRPVQQAIDSTEKSFWYNRDHWRWIIWGWAHLSVDITDNQSSHSSWPNNLTNLIYCQNLKRTSPYIVPLCSLCLVTQRSSLHTGRSVAWRDRTAAWELNPTLSNHQTTVIQKTLLDSKSMVKLKLAQQN